MQELLLAQLAQGETSGQTIEWSKVQTVWSNLCVCAGPGPARRADGRGKVGELGVVLRSKPGQIVVKLWSKPVVCVCVRARACVRACVRVSAGPRPERRQHGR